MNYTDPVLREIARLDPLDLLFADIAVGIQITPTDYQLAVDRYHTIHEWIEREESPLFGLVVDFYAQGGFAIGATVARYATDDEFDIDIMAGLRFHPDSDPEDVLAILHRSIRGEPGSRYHDKCERKTRCSTVNYSGMHLDVTAAVRLPRLEKKTSVIFHSKEHDKQSLRANPHGFASWFLGCTPPDEVFSQFFEQRSLDYNAVRLRAMAKADPVPVPDQAPAYRKSRAVIALQLIKRWRNLAYDRHYKSLRRPPSVLLAYLVACNANRTSTLSDELVHQVEGMIAALEGADTKGQTFYAVNPRCEEDELTDRWPTDLREQRLFIDELRDFAAELYRLRACLPLPQMQHVLENLFGERATGHAIRTYTGQIIRDDDAKRSLHVPGKGAVPALGSMVAAPTYARSTPRNDFFGE